MKPSESTSAARGELPGEIVKLGWLSLCLDVASEMSYPLVPLFLASVLNAPGIALGMIEGSAEALLAVMTAVAARHSDRIRRRVPFIRWGYGIAAVSKPLMALVGSWPTALGLRMLDRAGKGLRSAARDALIADLAGPARRGAAFGFHRTMDTAGALLGVLLALAILQVLPGHYRTVFALTAIPGAIAVALALRIRDVPRVPDARGARALPLAALPASLWRVNAVLWVFALGNSSDAFLLLRARDVASDAKVVWAYALMNLAYALTAFPAGRWSDRIGRQRLMVAGWSLYALLYLAFAWLEQLSIWPLFALYGVHLGLTQGVARAWISDHAPAELRATALGLYQLGLGATLLAASALAGWLWDAFDHRAPFLLGALCAVAALALLPSCSTRRA